MGCGTGILSILANKSGATSVIAIDNDEWAYQNTLDHFEMNRILNGRVMLGDAGLIGNIRADIILANINRNILIKDITAYAHSLKPGGQLFLSGFYHQDAGTIRQEAFSAGLTYEGMKTRNDWIAMKFCKSAFKS